MKKAMLWALCLSVFALAAACMTSPLDNSSLKTKAEPILFEGYHLMPQGKVQIYIQDHVSGTFELLGEAQADGANPKMDSKGQAWYKWSKTLQLKTGSQYWVQNGNELRAKVKAMDGVHSLTTFGAGVDTCWHEQVKNGGFVTMQQCASKSSPVVTLKTLCGGANQCACGGLGQPCCANGTCASGSCQSGTCKACGGLGQPCCGTSCTSGSCQNGTCKACGGLGQPCCANSICTSGACQNGTCKACGGQGQPCCPGNTCKPGPDLNLTCHNGVCDCAEWGESCGPVPCCNTANKCFSTKDFAGATVMRCCKSVDSNFGCN